MSIYKRRQSRKGWPMITNCLRLHPVIDDILCRLAGHHAYGKSHVANWLVSQGVLLILEKLKEVDPKGFANVPTSASPEDTLRWLNLEYYVGPVDWIDWDEVARMRRKATREDG